MAGQDSRVQPVGFADLKGGFLSDSLWEFPQKIGIADRPEAGPLDFVEL